jgi:archaellum biogenesis ATPase FlaH
MSHLQRHLSNLKSLSLSPESLLSSSLTVFQEIGRDVSHHTISDKYFILFHLHIHNLFYRNTLRKYYQFLVECYKLIDKNLLAPDYLQSLALSQTSDRILHLVKQFIMVWTMINQDQEELLTLKLWINFLQKANILKAVIA